MTSRERDIFRIIESDPFVSQNQIAALLGLSRSAVSSYLNSMYKKGIIRGRGYIIREESYPLLIGPSHIDIRSVCDPTAGSEVYPSTDTRIIHGGPTKNTAEYLLGLGVFPKAIFAVAADSFGSAFLASCKDAGIEADGSVIVEGASSPVYIEMVDMWRKFLTASFATKNLSTYITPAHLDKQQHILKNASVIVVHDSLPAESVKYLSRFKSKARLILVASEQQYMTPMTPSLGLFDVVILPRYIAHELIYGADSKAPGRSTEEVRRLGQALLDRGIGAFYLILNDTDICYGDRGGLFIHTSQSAVPMNVPLFRVYLDYRDLFAAVVTYGEEHNLEPEKTLGLLAAARNMLFASGSYSIHGVNLNQLQENAGALDETIASYNLVQSETPVV